MDPNYGFKFSEWVSAGVDVAMVRIGHYMSADSCPGCDRSALAITRSVLAGEQVNKGATWLCALYSPEFIADSASYSLTGGAKRLRGSLGPTFYLSKPS